MRFETTNKIYRNMKLRNKDKGYVFSRPY